LKSRIAVGIPVGLRSGEIKYLGITLDSLLSYMSNEDRQLHHIIVFNVEREEEPQNKINEMVRTKYSKEILENTVELISRVTPFQSTDMRRKVPI